jgi:hypothetical protein
VVVGTAFRQLPTNAAASEGFEADMTTIVKTLETWAGWRFRTAVAKAPHGT